jgi:hypothetical protein
MLIKPDKLSFVQKALQDFNDENVFQPPAAEEQRAGGGRR